ncbi:unnamed protein product, partial [Protopolystoma xenopodis]
MSGSRKRGVVFSSGRSSIQIFTLTVDREVIFSGGLHPD